MRSRAKFQGWARLAAAAAELHAAIEASGPACGSEAEWWALAEGTSLRGVVQRFMPAGGGGGGGGGPR
jgi:hypothetical protein